MSRVRRASHSGTWYASQREELDSKLSKWLSDAKRVKYPARAVIAPHAGYYYCGACAGHAYIQVDPSIVKRVFILGPSHHVRIPGCALSSTERYQTPFYDLPIDHYIYSELESTGHFEKMSKRIDEDEHSIEMHLPYIAKIMERAIKNWNLRFSKLLNMKTGQFGYRGQFTIVPVLVGGLTPVKERLYGEIFSKYLGDPGNLFVISSDFCHWGERFNYCHYDKSQGEVWQSIENLDRMGMNIIESLNPAAFTEYLKNYGNTICGRHPIGVLLNALDFLQKSGTLNGHKMSLQFTQYAQSGKCTSRQDSSVSYASAALTIM